LILLAVAGAPALGREAAAVAPGTAAEVGPSTSASPSVSPEEAAALEAQLKSVEEHIARSTGPLVLTLMSSEAVYDDPKEVELEVAFQNISTSEVMVNRYFAPGPPGFEKRNVHIRIIGPDGEKLKWPEDMHIKYEWLKRRHFVILEPGKESDIILWPLDFEFEFVASGEYRVKLWYENRRDWEGLTAWKGLLESNEITFRVKPRAP
jgi:hypothetical protein